MLASNAPAILGISFIIFMVIGVPITWSLGASCFLSVMAIGNMPISVICQRIFTGSNSFALLAIPAFVVAGEVMSNGGISRRLVDMATLLIGRIQGSLGIVSIVACTLFAALTGAATATTAAIGGIMYPEMEKRGYPKDFSAAVQAIGGTLGPVIPPSILFIMYGVSTGNNIPKLLMSGVIPGILTCIALCFLSYVIAVKENMPKSEINPTAKEKLMAIKESFFALLMPVIILGGIYSGIFTPTESAGIAVVYGLIVSVFIYKELDFKGLMKIFKQSALTSANLIILVATAQLFGWLISYFNIPQTVANMITNIASSKIVFLLLVNLILFIAGMFMEAVAIVLIMAPILAPLAVTFGVDPIHFGFVVVFMLCLGIATPPFGPCLFVACGISKQPFVSVSKRLIPFIVVQGVCALIFTFVPSLTTWLPSLM